MEALFSLAVPLLTCWVRFCRKSINGKTRTISVNSTDTIRQIKEQIRDKEGINPDEQRLIYAGKNLDDTKTVADYNLSADATLHLVLRVRGGN